MKQSISDESESEYRNDLNKPTVAKDDSSESENDITDHEWDEKMIAENKRNEWIQGEMNDNDFRLEKNEQNNNAFDNFRNHGKDKEADLPTLQIYRRIQ